MSHRGASLATTALRLVIQTLKQMDGRLHEPVKGIVTNHGVESSRAELRRYQQEKLRRQPEGRPRWQTGAPVLSGTILARRAPLPCAVAPSLLKRTPTSKEGRQKRVVSSQDRHRTPRRCQMQFKFTVQGAPLKSKSSAWAPTGVEIPDEWGGNLDDWGGTFHPSML